MAPSREDRIRDEAHRLWLLEGQPTGREAAHWHLAEQLVGLQDGVPHSGEAAAALVKGTSRERVSADVVEETPA